MLHKGSQSFSITSVSRPNSKNVWCLMELEQISQEEWAKIGQAKWKYYNWGNQRIRKMIWGLERGKVGIKVNRKYLGHDQNWKNALPYITLYT